MRLPILFSTLNFALLLIAYLCLAIAFPAHAQSTRNWWRDDQPILPETITEEAFLKAFEYWHMCRFAMPIRVSLRAPHGARFNMESPVGREIWSVVKIFREQIGIDFKLVGDEEETNIALYVWQDDDAEYSYTFPLNKMFVTQDRISHPANAIFQVFIHTYDNFGRIFSNDGTMCLGATLMLKADRQTFRRSNGRESSDAEQSEYIKHRVRQAFYQLLGYLMAGQPSMPPESMVQPESKNYLPPPLFMRVLYDSRLDLRMGNRPFLRELYREMKGVKE